VSEPLLLSFEGGAGVLTLNRGADGNRLGTEMCAALDRAAAELAARDGLRAVLIRAEGRMFSVGGAINEFTASGDFASYLRALLPVGHRAMRTLAALTCPVVSVVQGPVGGAGIALALIADFVLAGQAMVLRAGYPALGVTSDFGVSWLVTRLAGKRVATDILMSNRAVTADEARALGLVTSVHADADLDAEARALLARLASGPTQALSRFKTLIGGGDRDAYCAHLDLEERLMLEAAATADAREGVEAFLGKRPAVFTGRS
jgi:2-(1,2-epoxy-1,2-dihydrophenyl)acetyl-CoA isomerase